MHPLTLKRLARAERQKTHEAPPRVWSPTQGIHYCPSLPLGYLEPCIPLVTRVVDDKADRLRESIRKHGLANPLITVSYLPAQNLSDWREWRYRFLYRIAAPIKIVVGHNRYAAIQALGWTHVPVLHCGPIPAAAAGEAWETVAGIEAAQRYCRDGELGAGPYSLVMDQYTTPLKAMPAGFEA